MCCLHGIGPSVLEWQPYLLSNQRVGAAVLLVSHFSEPIYSLSSVLYMESNSCNPFERIEDLSVGLKERIAPVIGHRAFGEILQQGNGYIVDGYINAVAWGGESRPP
jgi:hypothetical protein